MEPIYLNNWEAGGFFDMVADFEDIFITKSEYEAARAPWKNVEMWEEKKRKMDAALMKDMWQDISVILASYEYENYLGEAFVLFARGGSLFEVNASHCSCYGLEGQWSPEPTTWEAIRYRYENGKLGSDGFHKELGLVLNEYHKRSAVDPDHEQALEDARTESDWRRMQAQNEREGELS